MLPKNYRLTSRQDFSRIYREGRSVANREFVCYTLDNLGVSEFRMGLSVSKKIGNAVTRNRLKRLVREVIYEERDHLKLHMDMVIIARVAAKNLDYLGVKRSLHHLLRKADAFGKE